MGCNPVVDDECESDEAPQHPVELSAYAIDATEVTAAAYAACTASGCAGGAGEGAEPISAIGWNEAKAYCQWTGKELCSEAQWEMAARGGCALYCDDADYDTCCKAAMPKYPWGDAAPTCDLAVTSDCDRNKAESVGSKPAGASPYGTLDMAGNVWEWVEDCFHDSYNEAPDDGSAWSDVTSCHHVLRGGSFRTAIRSLRTSNRHAAGSWFSIQFGFRCCRPFP